MIYFSGWS